MIPLRDGSPGRCQLAGLTNSGQLCYRLLDALQRALATEYFHHLGEWGSGVASTDCYADGTEELACFQARIVFKSKRA